MILVDHGKVEFHSEQTDRVKILAQYNTELTMIFRALEDMTGTETLLLMITNAIEVMKDDNI